MKVYTVRSGTSEHDVRHKIFRADGTMLLFGSLEHVTERSCPAVNPGSNAGRVLTALDLERVSELGVIRPDHKALLSPVGKATHRLTRFSIWDSGADIRCLGVVAHDHDGLTWYTFERATIGRTGPWRDVDSEGYRIRPAAIRAFENEAPNDVEPGDFTDPEQLRRTGHLATQLWEWQEEQAKRNAEALKARAEELKTRPASELSTAEFAKSFQAFLKANK